MPVVWEALVSDFWLFMLPLIAPIIFALLLAAGMALH
jgi:hypothetical protein